MAKGVLVLASQNQGKVQELKDLLAPQSFEVRSISEWTQVEPVEDGASFEDNALIKARACFDRTGLASLADDSGLQVHGLDDAPGIFSARWAGPNKDFGPAMARVISELQTRYGSFDHAPRTASFVCALALVTSHGREQVFRGICSGEIVPEPRGSFGFGYDPIFIPYGDTRTFGEMNGADKRRYSHRVKAFALLERYLREHDL